MSKSKINAFLQSAKAAFKDFGALKENQSKQKFKFVFGNQSGDLDSIVSSISYAYYSHIFHETSINNKTQCLGENQKHWILPILNLKQDELALRKDVVYLLERLQISQKSLCFIDDVAAISRSGQAKDTVGLVLVDHNSIESNIKKHLYNGQNVVSIIDHHKDEQQYLDAQPRVISPVGSCSTLVSEYWLKQLGVINNGEGDSYSVNRGQVEQLSSVVDFGELVTLMASPLLVDTAELKFKTTDTDIRIFKVYNEIIAIANTGLNAKPNFRSDFDTCALFADLKREKNKIDDLSIANIIKKDYKSYTFQVADAGAKVRAIASGSAAKDANDDGKTITVGIASVVKPIEWLVQRDGYDAVNDSVDKFGRENNVNLVIILTNSTDAQGQYRRELALKPVLTGGRENDDINQQLAKMVTEALLESDLKLESKGKSGNSVDKLSVYGQGNVKASRKQVAPIVGDILRC